jgi:transposase
MSSRELYVGVDVANAKVDASFLNAQGRPVRAPATYGNDPEGWAALRTAIVAAARMVGSQTRVMCGMEATSNMHQRLAQALRKESRCALEVHVLNPRAVKNFARALLKDSKTDKADSRLIALFLLRMQPQPITALPEGFEEFQEATRTRRRLVEERTDNKNRLHKLMRYHFPGYKKLLGKSFSKGALTVMEKWSSPDTLLGCPQEELAALQYGRKGRQVGATLAEKLHILAAQAPRQNLPPVSRLLIQTTTRRILELDDLIRRFDRAIEEMLDQLFPHQVLTTIPGIAKVSAAAILAEVGDIHRFTDKTHFVGYCGLYPIVWESGEAKRRYRMTRKGNRMLKMTLLVASAPARQYNPAIAVYYERLRRRGKTTKAAGGAIARKLAELVFTVVATGEPWSPVKAATGMEKAQSMLAQGSQEHGAGAPCLTGDVLTRLNGPKAYSRSGGSRTTSIPQSMPDDYPTPEATQPFMPGSNLTAKGGQPT